MEPVTILIVLTYLLPSFIAVGLRHYQVIPIILINVLLGWTIIG